MSVSPVLRLQGAAERPVVLINESIQRSQEGGSSLVRFAPFPFQYHRSGYGGIHRIKCRIRPVARRDRVAQERQRRLAGRETAWTPPGARLVLAESDQAHRQRLPTFATAERLRLAALAQV